MPTLQSVRDEAAALATVAEDQFEANLTTLLADIDAVIAGNQPPTCPTAVSVAITMSDGSVQNVQGLPPPPAV